MRKSAIVVVLVAVSLTGCATPTGTPSTGDSTSSTSTPPSSGPTPSSPPPTTIASDQLPSNVVVGTVTTASSGPCYLVETDDGKLYALIGSGGTVNRGQRVKATIEQKATMVDCGAGNPVALVKLEVSS